MGTCFEITLWMLMFNIVCGHHRMLGKTGLVKHGINSQ